MLDLNLTQQRSKIMSVAFQVNEVIEVHRREGLFIIGDIDGNVVGATSIGGWDNYRFNISDLRKCRYTVPPIYYKGEVVTLHSIHTGDRAGVSKMYGMPFYVEPHELSIAPPPAAPEAPHGGPQLGVMEMRRLCDKEWGLVDISAIGKHRVLFSYSQTPDVEYSAVIARHAFRPVQDYTAEVIADLSAAINADPLGEYCSPAQRVIDALNAGKIRHIKWSKPQ